MFDAYHIVLGTESASLYTIVPAAGKKKMTPRRLFRAREDSTRISGFSGMGPTENVYDHSNRQDFERLSAKTPKSCSEVFQRQRRSTNTGICFHEFGAEART